MNLVKKKIAIIGLGYVGLPLAVEFGKNIDVIGFDINVKRVKELINGQDNTLEISSDELKLAKNLEFTTDIDKLKMAQVFIVTVPTPIDSANRPDLKPLIKEHNGKKELIDQSKELLEQRNKLLEEQKKLEDKNKKDGYASLCKICQFMAVS